MTLGGVSVNYKQDNKQMLTKIYFPIKDTHSIKCDTNLTVGDFEVLDNLRRTGRYIDAYLEGNQINDGYMRRLGQSEFVNKVNDDKYSDEIECEVLDSNRYDIHDDFILNNAMAGKKFVLIININPETIPDDAEEDVRFWIDDSIKLWKSNKFDNNTKLKFSRRANIKIELSDGEMYMLCDCIVFEQYATEKNSLRFAILVNKAEKI